MIYWQQSFGWTLLLSTVLLHDLVLPGYLANAKVGARLYNITHAKLLPSALAIMAVVLSNAEMLALALVWFVHIGFDRMPGYGLKYPEGFKITHLGVIGKAGGVSRGNDSPCFK